MMRALTVLVAAAAAFSSLSCKDKTAEFAEYDNTSERLKFHERKNAEVLETLTARKAELEGELAGELEEPAKAEKQQELETLVRRLERPKFFEILTEADLPQDLEWTTNLEEPEIGSPEAKKGGTYHTFIPGGSYPPTIRPLGREANNSFRSFHWDDIEMSLTTYHPDTGKPIPALADQWAVAADGQTVYYRIDKNARWSDGKDVKSGDWLMAFYIYLSPYLTEAFYRAYYGEQYWGIATYGDDYVCIRLANPKPMAEAFAGLTPFQEEFYKEFGPDFESRYNWRPRPTTGAYRIRAEDIQKGRSIALTRVQDWWAKDKKYYRHRFNPDRIEYIQVRDEEKIFQLFLRGDIDVYLLGDSQKWYEKTEVPEVFNGYIEKATFYNQYPTVSRGLYFNLHQQSLKNVDVRIGLQHAANWEKVIELDMRGDAERLHLLNAGYGEFSHPTLRARPFSVEKAREHFAKAGFTERDQDGILKNADGKRLSFTITYPRHPIWDPILMRIKEEARRAGVEYKLEGIDPVAAFQRVTRKEHEIAFTGWQSQLPIPDYYQGFHSKDAYEPGSNKPRPMTNNITVFADPEVDKILEENRAARSLDVIRETSHKLEEIFHERAVWVPAFQRPFYRVGYWRWIRWPEGFNVRLGNDPEMNHVLWIDPEIKKDTLDAMKSGRVFPEQNIVFDQHRSAPSPTE
jgi:microcin C transport system substrate-binding protein